MLLPPLLRQPLNRRRRQAGSVLAEQLLERRRKVPRGQEAQVEHRQHVSHPPRATRVVRQDLRAEADPLAGLLVHALVAHARRADRQRARTDGHPPLLPATVAHHQPTTLAVELVREALHVLVDLGLERSCDHPTSALTRELIQRDRDAALLLNPIHTFRV